MGGFSFGGGSADIATAAVPGLVRASRWPSGKYRIVGMADGGNLTTVVLGAARIHAVKMQVDATAWSAMAVDVVTGGAAGTSVRLVLYRSGTDGVHGALAWYSALLAADAAGALVATFGSGTTVLPADVAGGVFRQQPGADYWPALWTEDLPTMRAVAASSAAQIGAAAPPWPVGVGETHRRAGGQVFGGAPADPLPATNGQPGTVPAIGLLAA